MPERCCATVPQADTLLGRQLHEFAASGAVTLQLITAGSMAEHILPCMLPRGWRGQEKVSWSGAADHPPAQALKAAWSLLATLPDAATLQDWPLVPVHPKTLCQLGSPSKVPCRNYSVVLLLVLYNALCRRNLTCIACHMLALYATSARMLLKGQSLPYSTEC